MGIKAPLTEGDIKYKMKEIVNNFLLVRDKFMLKMHLNQPGFTDSACSPFTKKQRKN